LARHLFPRYFNRRNRDEYNKGKDRMTLICEKLGDERGDGHKKVLQLWVGNEDAAGDETLLRGQNIKSRMSLMGRPTKRLKNVIDCMFYDGDEMGLCEQTDPLKLEALIRDILQNWSSGSLLLYCSQGRRRSVWAAAWTLIIECGLTPADAQRHVHSCRRIATFERNFTETARQLLRRLPPDLLRADRVVCPKVVPKQTFLDLMKEAYHARTPSPEPPEPLAEEDVKEETSDSSDVEEVRAALVSGVEEEEEEESEESEEAEGEESEEESEEEDEVPPVAARPAAAPPTKAPRTQKPAGDAAPAVAAPAAAAAAPPTKAPRTKKPAVDPAPAVAPPAAAAAARSAKAAPAAPEASTGAVLAGSTSKAQPAPPAAPAAPAALAASTSKEPVALSVRGASASSSSIMFTNSFKPTSEII